jgi:hypothetical protein
MVYLLKAGDGPARCIYEQHTLGLFGKDVWIKVMTDVGFVARSVPFEHSEFPGLATDVFVGRRPSEQNP